MKRITLFAVLAIALANLTSIAADRPRGGGFGWGAGAQYGRMYNPATVETMKGEVTAVEKFSPGKGMGSGIHVQLKTDRETISVHLGPSWFIDNQETQITMNDKIEVKGSRITFEGKPVVIAAEVTKGSEMLKLRDENGYPAWAGWRRR